MHSQSTQNNLITNKLVSIYEITKEVIKRAQFSKANTLATICWVCSLLFIIYYCFFLQKCLIALPTSALLYYTITYKWNDKHEMYYY